MKQNKIYELSYPDSVKLLKESLKKEDAIRKIQEEVYNATRDQVIKAVNKCVYETAERSGISVYSVCFNTIPIPEVSHDESLSSVTLVPIKFDFTHDGGYWKNKYYSLLQKVKNIVDEATEETTEGSKT